jgi:hypothetical protein
VNSRPCVEADRLHLCNRYRPTDEFIDDDWDTDEGAADHQHDMNEVGYAWRAVHYVFSNRGNTPGEL